MPDNEPNQAPDHKRRFYSVPEVAKEFNLSDKHVWYMIASGQLTSCKLGRRRLIPAHELDRLEYDLLHRAL